MSSLRAILARAILPPMSWQQQPSNAFNVLDLDELRKRLRKMSDNDLIKFGKDCAFLCSPKQDFGKPPDKVWSVQLTEARAEWRRRHTNPSAGNG
jgi:hypothetical protein